MKCHFMKQGDNTLEGGNTIMILYSYFLQVGSSHFLSPE